MSILRVRRGAECAEIRFEGEQPLGALLAAHGFDMARPCGGRGLCGKCAVTLRGDASPMNTAERRAGARLSCQAAVRGDCEVELPEAPPMERIETGAGFAERSTYPLRAGAPLAAAVDLGTTTLALRLFSEEDGRELAAVGRLNPQTAVAADVMGRIGAALQGAGASLRRQATEGIAALLDDARDSSGARGPLRRMVVTGNTAMLTLLTGRDPEALSYAPFQADCLFGLEEDVLGVPTYLPPCMHAFVGADITCAALACGLVDRPETALLCDVGTNGEMALWSDGTLRVASAPAGPAFEGAGIAMGCGSVRGAIDRVWTEGGALGAHTLGDAPAVGLCGSGLIDAVAALLRLGRVEPDGSTDEPSFALRDGVRLYPRDIRSVQLAKAAMAAGLQTLLKRAGADARAVERFFLAGGFGSRLSVPAAAAIGLFSAVLAPKARAVGNAALDGAALLLSRSEKRREAERLAGMARHVALGGDPDFDRAYLEQLSFPPAGDE